MTDFDPEFDKLPDQPPTIIGGDKSAAAWHGATPNKEPRANWHPDFRCVECGNLCRTEQILVEHKKQHEPHADLIADLRGLADLLTGLRNRATLRRAADALAALGDTVPREQYDALMLHSTGVDLVTSAERERDEARAERDSLQRGVVAATERAEAAEAERDALAMQDNRVRHILSSGYGDVRDALADLQEVVNAVPATSLALHDAEVKAQALDDLLSTMPDGLITPRGLTLLRARAVAIREEGK